MARAFVQGRSALKGESDVVFQSEIPGAMGQPHTTIVNAGHFLQEDNGEDLAQAVVDFIAANPK